jgi:hypothetical protein
VILQNGLLRHLPQDFTASLNSGSSSQAELAYAAIPVISTLPEPLRTQVRVAFATSLADIWKTMIGFAGAGLITVFFLREIKMHQVTDERFGMEDKVKANDVEAAEKSSEGEGHTAGGTAPQL